MKRPLSFISLLIILLCACQASVVPSPTNTHDQDPTASLTLTPVPSTLSPDNTPSSPISPGTPTLLPQTPSPLPSSTPTITPSPTSTKPPTTTLLFTGVIVPARCVQAKLDELGYPDYPYEEVQHIISEADLAIGTLNATISDYPPHTGCVRTYVLVGSADNADALARAGFDVMSVATNHIKNCGVMTCGDRAFFDTLNNLERVGVSPVGAGSNHAEAMQPVVVELNGIRFGFVSLGQIETMAFAGEDTPGIAVLNKENIQMAVDAARKVSDVVIFLPHWGPEDVPVPSYIQRDLAQHIVAAGADLVVGNHTHVVQAIQEIDSVPVFYGLGNFVFDQGLRDHKQGVILLVRFEGNEFAGYELIPTHVDQDGRVHIADEKEAAEIFERIKQASEKLP